ncbi:exonuclease SbcC [Sinosporangium album]|uniref:Nuclease SbcCD subunit C n=1 Tax=Sinosporangium album TaxID=504805 RepID=A0A1G8B6Z2_9ACTN|nr:SMC family ATPase [Sinosporangium album]SDH28763.1 exonuclease SbcC [Sinosporangium album]
MRPLRLHLSNFGSFREPTTVDFSGIDYFALVGPTGAGKSTVIDAICFALYGTAPRWGREKSVAPALAPSASAGEVALVFEAGGRRYGVVRVLQRSARGVVGTREARVEELDGTVPETAPLADLLAASVRLLGHGDGVTGEVERITGLPYKFFTQCVVLPQNRFAEFLHAPPRDRQDLLVQLLDAGVYERVGKRAGQEEKAARDRAEFIRDELRKIQGSDEAAERAASERLSTLRDLSHQVGLEVAALRDQDDELRRVREERAAGEERLTALTALAMPADVPTLADALRTARAAAAECARRIAELEAAERDAEDELSELPDRIGLVRTLELLHDHERTSAELAAAEAKAAAAVHEAALLATGLASAAAALTAAEAERERVRDTHTAAELARRLRVGEPCPACLRAVNELPHHPPLTDMETADRALRAAREGRENAERAHRAAELESVKLGQRVTALSERLTTLPAPATADGAELGRLIDAATAAETAAKSARAATREARAAHARAERRVEELSARAERGWRDLSAARDSVVALDAPPLDRDDLARAWTTLLTWREEAAARGRRTLSTLIQRLVAAEQALAAERGSIAERLRAHHVAVPSKADASALHEAAVTAVALASGELERIRRDREHAAALAAQAAELDEQARVAHELALMLRANNFERWLCSEALDVLVTSASVTLRDLSDGQFELALSDKNDIEVIDHREAGLARSVRTLSGGETFQAALALALALSDQVAGMAAAAARSLDSIFLDEGFGTLDPATLDTVAVTLERLTTGRDRMVGVVTHVPALAERVPVRFEITKDESGSKLSTVIT